MTLSKTFKVHYNTTNIYSYNKFSEQLILVIRFSSFFLFLYIWMYFLFLKVEANSSSCCDRLHVHDSPGMMTSGKPSLRVTATPRLKMSGFSLRTCSMSPLSSCSEMIRPAETEGDTHTHTHTHRAVSGLTSKREERVH